LDDILHPESLHWTYPSALEAPYLILSSKILPLHNIFALSSIVCPSNTLEHQARLSTSQGHQNVF
jgi:hypothetical protein